MFHVLLKKSNLWRHQWRGKPRPVPLHLFSDAWESPPPHFYHEMQQVSTAHSAAGQCSEHWPCTGRHQIAKVPLPSQHMHHFYHRRHGYTEINTSSKAHLWAACERSLWARYWKLPMDLWPTGKCTTVVSLKSTCCYSEGLTLTRGCCPRKLEQNVTSLYQSITF